MSAREPKMAVRFVGSMSLAKPVFGVPTVPFAAAHVLLLEYALLLYVPQEYVAAAEAEATGKAAPATTLNNAMLAASICQRAPILRMFFRVISSTACVYA